MIVLEEKTDTVLGMPYKKYQEFKYAMLRSRMLEAKNGQEDSEATESIIQE